MKSLRIVLTQQSANYRREETVNNKTTYILPPFSTIIGGIHSTCNWQTTHSINISVQGEYGTLNKEYVSSTTFYSNVLDDRGTLVKMPNGTSLSNAYIKVAKTTERDSDFKEKRGIAIYNKDLLQEFIDLSNAAKKIKAEKKELSDCLKIKKQDKGSDEYKSLKKKLENKKNLLKDTEEQKSYYRLLEHIPTFQEILGEVYLIIHISAKIEDLEEIEQNINNLTSFGRSEDFINVINAEIIELTQNDISVESKHSAYINYSDISAKNIIPANGTLGGTKYYLGKNYQIINNQRIFEKVKVLYMSDYKVAKFSPNIWVDTYENEKYIVNFN